MTRWIRYLDDASGVSFGAIDGADVIVHEGDMFGVAVPTGERVELNGVSLMPPCEPTKMIALWNNVASAAAKNGWSPPAEPLYFLKPPSSFVGDGAAIRRPRSYAGRICYEGEIGVVIGTRCVDVTIADADEVIFGYTCVNDITALELIAADPSFAQWSRAKGFNTFGAFGPAIVSGVPPDELIVRTLVGGKLRQEYPVSDLIFSPRELVSLISRDMTLLPGDVIACGTGLGVLPMRPGVPIEVSIDGIGVLVNILETE